MNTDDEPGRSAPPGADTGGRPEPAEPARPPGAAATPAPPPVVTRLDRRLLTRAGMLIVAIGLVLALLALPLLAGVGLFAKAASDHFVNLPSELVTPPLPQSSEILAADGTVIATLRGAENRVVVDGKDIPQIMRQAIVAIEDARFYSHHGVDPKGVLRAAARNGESGDVQQGGSTLTQQYVKNVLLQSAHTAEQRKAAAGTSLDRKIQELRYAVELEKKLSKDEILVRYLNIAYFGDGAYGVGTAARHYFGVNISQLTLEQAALLAGLVQSPSRYDPVNHPQEARARRDQVLDRMADEHHITPEQATAAKRAPVTVLHNQQAPVDSCEDSIAPFFCDYVRTELLKNPALGANEEERNGRLHEGGLKIHTTLDLRIQQAVQQVVNNTVPTDNRVSATEVVVQPGTGNILAMAVNRVYGDDAARNETKVALPTTATFQPGSTFKTFTMAAALEQGYGTSTAFYSPACYQTKAFPLDRGKGDCPKGFSNSDPAEAGVYNMSTGTWKSVNTYYVQLGEKIGVPAILDMAKRLGAAPPDVAEIGPTDGATTFGGGQHLYVSPLQMAGAYAALAAGGLRCAPRFVTSATDSSAEQVDVAPRPNCQQVVSQGIADTVTSVLAGVITNGTGNPRAAAIGRPAAGKTGTTDQHSAAWFVGYVPQMAAAVAVGDPHGAEGHPLRNVQAAGRLWPSVFGGDLPALIWGQSMHAALAGDPVLPLPPADPVVARGTKGGLLNAPPAPTLPPEIAGGLEGLVNQFTQGGQGPLPPQQGGTTGKDPGGTQPGRGGPGRGGTG